MKKILFLIASLLLVSAAFSQEKPGKLKHVTTAGVFDTLEAKSGYAINQYFVKLTAEEVKKYKGKKVEVRGRLSVIKAIDPNDTIIRQGPSGDLYLILDPKIKVIKAN